MVYVLISAAGAGTRFGSPLPKQFCEMGDRPVLFHTIEAVSRALPDSQIILILSEGAIALWESLCDKHNFNSPKVVIGGATRYDSVKNGLRAIADRVDDDDIILVHDGARPNISARLCRQLVDTARSAGSAIPVLPLTESIRVINNDGGTSAVNRSGYVSVQTPQAFKAGILTHAYMGDYCEAFTDDASVVEAAGYDITTIPGDVANIKITRPGDIEIAGILATMQ